jgi:HSP20 family protein
MLWAELARPRYWEPWRDVQRLQREVNRAFGSAFGAHGYEFPPLNVSAGDEEAVVTAELPGVRPEDLDITVTGDTLTIKGSRKLEEIKEGEAYHRHERPHGDFVRIIRMPFNIEADKVTAESRYGVLKLLLPRAEADRPRKIELKATD